MPVTKQHDEFHALDMTSGWDTPPGYPKGIQHEILPGELDRVGNGAEGTGGESFSEHTYACRPRGPFKSEQGRLLLEVPCFDLV